MRRITRTFVLKEVVTHHLTTIVLILMLGVTASLSAETITENATQIEPANTTADTAVTEQAPATENTPQDSTADSNSSGATSTSPELSTTPSTEPVAPTAGGETAESDKTNQPVADENSSQTPEPTVETNISDTTTADQSAPKKLQKFEVTGSHIKRVDIEGYSPVLSISREDINQSGASTLSDFLRNHPLENGVSFNENIAQWNSTSPGGSPISLRGFGVDATLVLINGRRFAPYAFAHNGSETFVDLNSIPLGAIERIEVLKDGASAIYGSDAITGVVNIILRKDYTGSEATLSIGQSDSGDAEEISLSAMTGREINNGNYTFTFDYFTRGDVGRIDRPFSASADHSDQPGGTDYRSQSSYPPYVISAIDFSDLQGTGTGDEKYDFNKDATLIPESERIGATLRANWDLKENMTLFSEVMLNRTTTKSQFAPVNFYHFDYSDLSATFGVSSGVNIIDPIPVTHPDNTFGEPVYVFWRMTEMGLRHSETVTDAQRLVVGLEGSNNDWDWDTALFYTRSESEFTEDNNVNLTQFANAINNGTLNPFGSAPNSPAVLNSIRATQSRKGTSDLYGLDAKGTKDLAELDAGPVTAAFGVGARHESLKDQFDDLTSQGLLIGKGGTSTDDSRDISSAFAEFNIPLLEDLEMQLAGRFEDYSDFGSTANPKVALRYQPSHSVLLRTSWGKGFRAPSLIQLNGSLTGLAIVADTTRCNNAPGPWCAATAYNANLSGNPDLDPTKSEAIYLGGVFEPISNVALAVDYWKYKREDVVRQSFQFTVDHEAQLPGRVIRGAPEFPGDLGPIALIDDTFTNIAEEEISGIDVDLKIMDKTSENGNFLIHAFFTKIFTFDSIAFPGEPVEDKKNAYHYPSLRHIINFGWGFHDYGFILTRNYVSDYEGIGGSGRVDSQITYDIQFNYSVMKSANVTIGIENLTDEEPPFANEEEGFDPAIHNPMGRYYYARYNHKF